MNRSHPTPHSFSTAELRTALRDVVGQARPDYLSDIVAEAGRTRQRPAWTFLERWLPVDIAVQGLGVPRAAAVIMVLSLVVVLVVAPAVYVGSQTKPAPVDLGIFAPVAGRVVYGDERGIWGVDPAAPADGATSVRLTSEAGIPLGWSSDGTRMLIMRGIMRGSDPNEQLFVLHADGSETQVTERPMSIRGGTIAPDGSRVVFAAATSNGGSALYAVDAQGGSAKVLLADANSGIRAPAYAPDGTRLAYINGGGDHSNSVWLMNADGSDAHPIVWNESDRWPGHVSGLTWSPAGDRIALGLGGKIYTFATDGSDFTQIAGGDTTCVSAETCAINLPKSAELPYWSPDGSRIAYTTGCVDGARATNRDGCHLAIADADGSNVLVFGFASSGPWHPARRQSGGGANASTAAAAAIPTPTPGQPVSLAGSWQATDPPADSSHLTMEAVAMPDGSYEVTIRDDFASVCDGVSSTMTGVAKTTDSGTIVIEQPEYVCDDGSQAQALSGPPLDEQLRNFTFTYDFSRDAFDGGGLEWTRVEAAP